MIEKFKPPEDEPLTNQQWKEKTEITKSTVAIAILTASPQLRDLINR